MYIGLFFLRNRKYIFEWCWWQVYILWHKFKKVFFWRLNKANPSKTKQHLVIVTLVPFCICFHSNSNSTISQKLEIRILKVYTQYFSFWLILLIIFDNLKKNDFCFHLYVYKCQALDVGWMLRKAAQVFKNFTNIGHLLGSHTLIYQYWPFIGKP